ncbi:MAG: hypothetical protein IAE91_05280 [Ignavibacteriaceae bacterium]|nr:hypothetical protein [Ignavibacteriaceae bacterium]
MAKKQKAANYQKFVIPGLLLIIVGIVIVTYFLPGRDLGTFDNIDPNAHLNKEVRVVLDKSFPFDTNSQPGKTIFRVIDRKGNKVMVAVEGVPPAGMTQAETIVVIGHFHHKIFDAIEVKLD